MSEFLVRAAKPTDEPEIVELARQEMQQHARSDPRFRLRADAASRYAVYLHDRLREIDSSVFVAEGPDSRILGAAIGSIRIQEAFFETRRFGYVSDLVVASDVRRLGVGTALWGRVGLWFRGLGVSVVRLHIAARSEAATGFWKSIGAEPFLIEGWIDLPSGEASLRGAAVVEEGEG
jgi:GNAT superfamily N-acetyltransferase